MMDQRQLLSTLCDKLVGQRSAATIIIENIDYLTDEDVIFLLGRIQRAVIQVKHENGRSSINQMNNLLQDLKSHELESAIRENNHIQNLLDQIDC